MPTALSRSAPLSPRISRDRNFAKYCDIVNGLYRTGCSASTHSGLGLNTKVGSLGITKYAIDRRFCLSLGTTRCSALKNLPFVQACTKEGQKLDESQAHPILQQSSKFRRVLYVSFRLSFSTYSFQSNFTHNQKFKDHSVSFWTRNPSASWNKVDYWAPFLCSSRSTAHDQDASFPLPHFDGFPVPGNLSNVT
jgi:hypothetical protein